MELDIFYTVHFLEINNFSWERRFFYYCQIQKVNDRIFFYCFSLPFYFLFTDSTVILSPKTKQFHSVVSGHVSLICLRNWMAKSNEMQTDQTKGSIEEIALIYLSASHHRLQLVLILLTNTLCRLYAASSDPPLVYWSDVLWRQRQGEAARLLWPPSRGSYGKRTSNRFFCSGLMGINIAVERNADEQCNKGALIK